MSQLTLIEAVPSNLPHEFAWWQQDVKSSNPSLNTPPLSGRIDVDVVIVGGGFTGLWTALTLRQASPGLRVAILEAYRCGDGASSRNGGNVHGYWGALPTLVPLFGVDKALESGRLGTLAQRKLASFATLPGRDVWWEEHGYLRVATSPAQMAKLDAFTELALELGIPETVRKLDTQELSAFCDSPRFVGGLLFNEGATVHPARLADALRTEALRTGVEIYEDTTVTSIGGQGPHLVSTKNGSAVARDVVLANYTGAMSIPSVFAATTIFSSFPVMSKPNEIALERMNYREARGIADLRMFTHYFRRTRDGRILMGSGSGPIAYGKNHAEQALRHDPRSAERAAVGLQRFFPELAKPGIEGSWGWPIEVSSDRLPYFGTVSGTRIHYGSGYSGHGVNATCIAGECLTSRVLDRKDQWLSSPFCHRDPLRFPPEPFRFMGGRLIRNAIVTCEDFEDARKQPPVIARSIAHIPKLLGMRIGMR